MTRADRLNIRQSKDGVVLTVKVVPGSSRDRIVGVLGDALKIATAAPAEKGKANVAAAAILARLLGVPRQSIQLIAGPSSARKLFSIRGVAVEEIRKRFQSLG